MEYGYVAYIDEAGDPGLTKVQPLHPGGASEWFITTAAVIRTQREEELPNRLEMIRTDLGIRQRRDLHYRNLSPTRRLAATSMVAQQPIRAFAVISNKKNMAGYRNARAEKIPSQQWFYNWCIRLLLERVTAFCLSRSETDYGQEKLVKLEFSRRGGVRYSQLRAYQAYLRHQQKGGRIYSNRREPVTRLLSTDLMFDHPHEASPGLQLADIVASAFYQAVDTSSPKWDVEPAWRLAPIMARERGLQRDFGVALFPAPHKAHLSIDQRQIFERFGYHFSER